MKKIIISLLAVVLIVLLAMNIINNQNSTNENSSETVVYGLGVTQTPYDYQYRDLNGQPVRLSDFKGKKVFMNFWASWCGPCRVEIPELIQVAQSRSDVVILGINVLESEKSEEVVRQFVKDQNMNFPVVFSTEKATQSFNAYTLPVSFFINTDGTIYQHITGPMNEAQIIATFDAMDN
ncbi:MAG: TlpA family protein disulfide reductase [Erysipelothrix sp.]|nr:TlpA family protein disulfide reductase [Erysipelothrix sp.]